MQRWFGVSVRYLYCAYSVYMYVSMSYWYLHIRVSHYVLAKRRNSKCTVEPPITDISQLCKPCWYRQDTLVPVAPHIVMCTATSDNENLPILICRYVVTHATNYTSFAPKADNCMHKQLDEDAQTHAFLQAFKCSPRTSLALTITKSPFSTCPCGTRCLERGRQKA